MEDRRPSSHFWHDFEESESESSGTDSGGESDSNRSNSASSVEEATQLDDAELHNIMSGTLSSDNDVESDDDNVIDENVAAVINAMGGRGDRGGRGRGRGLGRGGGRGRGRGGADVGVPVNLLQPHGQLWTEIDGKTDETAGQFEHMKARLLWPNTFLKPVEQRTPLDYFEISHPRSA